MKFALYSFLFHLINYRAGEFGFAGADGYESAERIGGALIIVLALGMNDCQRLLVINIIAELAEAGIAGGLVPFLFRTGAAAF